jgi:hypothetical protein
VYFIQLKKTKNLNKITSNEIVLVKCSPLSYCF